MTADTAALFLLGAVVGGLIVGVSVTFGLALGYGLGLHHASERRALEGEAKT